MSTSSLSSAPACVLTLLLSLCVGCGDDGGGVAADGGGTDTQGGTADGTETEVASETDSDTDVDTDVDAGPPPNLDIASYPLPLLSDYHFFAGDFTGDAADLEPNEGVVGYTVAAPLWADAAEKGRFFAIPEGSTIGFTEENEWAFPTGSVFIKNFFFDLDRGAAEDLRIIETRLLVLEASGEWSSYIYLWNDEQTEAEQVKAGADVEVDYLDEGGQAQTQLYLVPDQNVCESCHQRDDATLILGPTTRQLNTVWPIGGDEPVNQIDWLAENGFFSGEVSAAVDLPALANPAGDAALEERARAYLHGNCAHCHRAGGDGGSSGLKFSILQEDPADYGVCKLPAAAGAGAGGRTVDIFPGDPEQSIVPFRMASEDPEVKMPELPNLMADDFGVALVEQWISEMTLPPCE